MFVVCCLLFVVGSSPTQHQEPIMFGVWRLVLDDQTEQNPI